MDPDFEIQNPRTAKILNVEYIVDTILDVVSPVDAIHFASSCRLAKRSVTRYRSFVFNINRRLRRFFHDPLAFRSLQAKTHTLISGSFALQFFDRSEYADSDLDLYTHPGFSRAVGHWLIDEGYEFQPCRQQDISFDVADKSNWRGVFAASAPCEIIDENPDGDGYQFNGVWDVYSFKRIEGGHVTNVQIIASSKSPFETILNFHSTIVQNFISYSHAHSLYPKATFVHRQGLCLERTTLRYQAALTKYRARGWDIQESPTAFQTDFAMDVDRWVNDSMSWVISLDLNGVWTPESYLGIREVQDDPVTLNNFRLSSSTCEPGMVLNQRHLTNVMLYDTLTSPLLAYQYLIFDKCFLLFCTEFLDELWNSVKEMLIHHPVEVQERVWPWVDCRMGEIRRLYFSRFDGLDGQ